MTNQQKGGIVVTGLLVAVGVWIGTNLTWKEKAVDQPSPSFVQPAFVPSLPEPTPKEPDPIEDPSPKPDFSKVSNKDLIAEYEAWSNAHKHDMEAMPERVFYVLQEILRREKDGRIEYKESNQDSRRRWRRRR